MPTISLANTVCFHIMTNQEKQFPMVRVFGTIGWIVAGLVIALFLAILWHQCKTRRNIDDNVFGFRDKFGIRNIQLHITTHAPACKRKKSFCTSIIGLDAFKQLGSRSFYVFLISSFLICIPLAAYYNFTQIFLESAKFRNIAATQTIGQVSETLFMLLMPFFFMRLGIKWMLAGGMLAWALRYLLFALGAPDLVTWMILTGIALHGICYDFFFVAGQIYVDKKASPQIRGQSQGLIIFTTYGVGLLVGAQIAGAVYNSFLGSTNSLTLEQWQSFWLIPAVFAVVVLVLFSLFFKDKSRSGVPAEPMAMV